MPIYIAAFLIGVVTGLRSMTAPAAVSWAARLGWLHLQTTWLAFLGFAATPYIGPLGGYEFRVRLVKARIALLEDAIAIGGAFLIVSRF